MSTNLKNFGLLILLFSLCFLIKCKLDQDHKQTQKNIKLEQPNTAQNQKVLTTVPTTTAKDSNQSITKEKADVSSISSNSNTEILEDTKTQEKPKPVATKKKTKKKKKTPKRLAKIEFETTTWDFGEITEGDIVKKDFQFTNTGEAPLQIIGADASCGCARPTVPFLDIAPGETNKIGVIYNSVNKDGDQEPEIIIESNTYPKHTILKLFGTVKSKPEEEEKKVDIPTKKSAADSNEVVQDSIKRN